MLSDLKIGLKQRFNIKCGIDMVVFIIFIALFLSYSLKNGNSHHEAILYLAIMIILFISTHFITKQWIQSLIRKALTIQSKSVSETTLDIVETLSSQKKVLENLALNTKNLSNLIEKLKNLSQESLLTSKNTEKQVAQSISFS